MATEKQIEANRKNAQKGTGPASTEGKYIVSQNARTHGLFSTHILIPGEDETEFAQLRENAFSEFSPNGFLEQLLTDRLVSLLWRLRRLTRLETGFLWNLLLDGVARQASTDIDASSKVTDPMAFCDPIRTTEIIDEDSYSDAQKRRARVSAARREQIAIEGRAFRDESNTGAGFGVLSRYETTIERQFFRTLHELQRLQASRKGVNVPPPAMVEVDF